MIYNMYITTCLSFTFVSVSSGFRTLFFFFFVVVAPFSPPARNSKTFCCRVPQFGGTKNLFSLKMYFRLKGAVSLFIKTEPLSNRFSTMFKKVENPVYIFSSNQY